MKQTLILGNIITMDEKKPFARAVLVKDGVFAYIGGFEEAKEMAGADAEGLSGNSWKRILRVKYTGLQGGQKRMTISPRPFWTRYVRTSH